MEEKQYYKEKRISSSSLKYFEQSPLLFKKFLESEIEQEEKQYLTRGKQIHMAILEPELFDKNYTYLEYETPKSEQQRKFCEDYLVYLSINKDEDQSLLRAYQDNYKAKKKDETQLEEAKQLKDKLDKYIKYLKRRKEYKDVLSHTDWQRIQDLKINVLKHKLANKLLANEELSNNKYYNELVIFWKDPLHNLPCKSMLDRLIIDEENKKIILVDLKTVNSFEGFKDRCRDFKYFRQMAFYWYAVTWYFINELKKDINEYSKETYIIALKTTDDAEVKVYTIRESYLSEGFIELTEILANLKWHWDNEQWEYTRSYYNGDGYEEI